MFNDINRPIKHNSNNENKEINMCVIYCFCTAFKLFTLQVSGTDYTNLNIKKGIFFEGGYYKLNESIEIYLRSACATIISYRSSKFNG